MEPIKIRPYLRKVQFYETDGMGIVHHANYIYWMEEARTDLMDQLGWGYDKAVEAGIDFALTEVNCKYRSMTPFGETVAITVTVTRLTPARVDLHYDITSAADGTLRAQGESRHFFYDRAKGAPVALKKVLPEVYGRLAALLGHPEERKDNGKA